MARSDRVFVGGRGVTKIDSITVSLDARLVSYQALITQWARDRNLIDGSTAQAQTVKLLEEAGELAGGVCRGNTNVIADSIGDCVVVLVILAAQCGLDFGECVEGAYNEIKDRRGKMVDGMFVKEEE